MRVIVCLGIGLLLCGLSAPANHTSIDKFKKYRTWYLVTPEPIDMAPAIAISCVGPSAWDSAPSPHVPRVFKVYVNSLGKRAMLAKGKANYPVGSIIIKEKFVRPAGKPYEPVKLAKDAKPELLTAMVKREMGFDSENGDWEYLVLSGSADKANTDGLDYCAKCHRDQKEGDYVFGSYGSLVRAMTGGKR